MTPIDWEQHHDTIVELAPTLNPKRIAEKLGIKRTTLQNYMQRNQIETCSLRVLEGGDHQLIAELYYTHGETAGELAKKFGCSQNHIYYVLRHTPLDKPQQQS